MNRLLKCGLTLLILLSSCASQNTTTEISPDAWRADLRYLERELPSRHVNAFHTVPREVFAGEVARLDAAIPRMNGDEVLVGLMRIVALIGDGHTHLDLPPSFLRYPVELQWFGDELRVVVAGAPYHAALGARVLAIGAKPLFQVMELATQLVPRGENDARTRFAATMQFTSPEVLHGLGVISDGGNAPFFLELASGERATVTFSPARLDFSTWRLATGEKPPLYLQRLTEVITGSGTFSAAAVNALDLRNEANAILVGAPTGIRPSHYGDHGDFRLPNCGLRISCSTRYHRFGNADDSALVPDRHIEPTWAEFRAGRDPVLEWILSGK